MTGTRSKSATAAGAKAPARKASAKKTAARKAPSLLLPLRAPGLRGSVAREFAVPTTIDGIPLPLNFIQIQGDPRLIALSSRIQAEMRMQFAPSGPGKIVDTEDDAAYRQKLEAWADALEVMLEEVLNELERIKPMRIPETQELV